MQSNNIIGYTLTGQPIYGQVPQTIQATPRLTAPIPQQQSEQPDLQLNTMTWVDGFIETKAYRVVPGNTVVLWDKSEDKIYIKSTDMNGVPQKMRILSYVDVSDEGDDFTVKVNPGLSKDEIDKLIEERFNEMFDQKFKDRKFNKKPNQHYSNKREDGDLNNE